MHYSTQTDVHFLHIGKTGGTAIKAALAEDIILTQKYRIHLHRQERHNLALKNIPEGEKVFFFLRDPLTRFVSGFYSRQRQGRPRHNLPWSDRERAAFKIFTTPNDLALALTSHDRDQQLAAITAMKSIMHVKDFYWWWFDNSEYLLRRLEDILFVGFQESLNQDFLHLKRILDLPRKVQLPDDDVASHRTPSYLDPFLDDKAKRNLRLWYANDIALVNLFQGLSREMKN